jgi:glucose-6-phosphate 1-dehydrogenase
MAMPTAPVTPLGAVVRPAARVAPPCAFVIFGASGDLTRRKLVPALYQLERLGLLPDTFAVVGIARRPLGDDAFRDAMRAGVAEFSRGGAADPQSWPKFGARLFYETGGFDDPATYRQLDRRLAELDRSLGLGGNRLFYLATPPAEFPVVLEQLCAGGLIRRPGEGPWTRVVIEKPFGCDLDSARALDGVVARCLDETQAFRIDHYLGKETVQNILVLRFANSIFEPIWNRKYVDHVEITAAETAGVGTRGAFYEQAGVLRDIVQNHLLELLSLTAMEPPNHGDADDIRGEKIKVVRALRPLSGEDVRANVVLGQYRDYRQEAAVAPGSVTPTFAALRVHVDNWRWQGVPFFLRAGKRLARRVTEISLHMQPIPLSLFGTDGARDRIPPNVLTLRIQPDEGIQLSFASKVPGHELAIAPVLMDMSYRETFGGEPPEAYERLLFDAMRGDATLFSRRDAVEASWGWITPILRWFEEHPPTGFPDYEPGTWGPARCRELKGHRRPWREP